MLELNIKADLSPFIINSGTNNSLDWIMISGSDQMIEKMKSVLKAYMIF